MKKNRKEETDEPKKVRVRVVHLNEEGQEEMPLPEEPPEKSGGRRRQSGRNTELALLTWLFSAMFVVLVGYLVWFEAAERTKITANPYYSREETGSDRVIRGSVVTENGTVLASSGIDYTGNEIRTYPYGNVFAHVVGYASNGRSGLEASGNSILTNSHSPLLDQLRNAQDNQKIQGDTMVVTLDPRLQQAAWYALGTFRGAVVVLEPDSGRILAMVSKPDFDPNMISLVWDDVVNDNTSGTLLNRATQGLYPPGSTFKILTSLAWLRENGNAWENFSYNCEGSETRGDVTITCYNGAVHGPETLRSAFANSCNTAFASIGLDLDDGSFRSLCEKFYFNKPLPTDLIHSQSKFSLKRDSSEGEEMTTAIGQGDTLVTPLHMAMLAACVANSGIMMKPYLISRVETVDGMTVSETRPEICGELMTVDEAQILGEFMQATVREGTGEALSWNSYSVAGKTGSAEYDAGGTTGTHSWFVGYSNVDDPDIALAVIAEDGGTGSSTAVPIAQQIFDAYYYG